MINDTAARPILFFDGVCNLCNSSVQFIIRHDRRQRFRFASLQSVPGQKVVEELKKQYGKVPDSLILFYKDKYYTRSSAALHVCRLLGGGWSLLYAGMIVPGFIRNAVYDLVARNRYKWFGHRNECMIPAPELKSRFLIE